MPYIRCTFSDSHPNSAFYECANGLVEDKQVHILMYTCCMVSAMCTLLW